MERVISDLRRSYPDLAVSIEGQEADDDLVRTRVVLSGTDMGGVLWYPPTGRRATFAAEFVDRFSDGRLVEHSGEADTEGLLRQLGLAEARGIRPRDPTPKPEGETASRDDLDGTERARPEGRAQKPMLLPEGLPLPRYPRVGVRVGGLEG
jgi:hypothetical protein